MIEKITVPYNGTPEQEAELEAMIARYKGTQSPLIPVMEETQEIFGYLPEKALLRVSEELDVTMARIYGVATFYSFFSLYPKGRNQISVCLGTACYVRGSGDIHDKLEQILGIKDGQCTDDGRFSLDNCRCVGACGLAPVMLINGDVYGNVKVKELDNILAKYE